MSFRQQTKFLFAGKNPPYYLVFFKVDRTVAPTKASYIIEKADILEVGSVCHVKDKSGIYEGIVVTYGSKDEVDNVEEQYLNGLYTPEFLVGLCDDSDDDDQDNDNKENEEPDRDFIEKEDVSRKRKTDGTAKLSKKTKKKSVPKKTKELKKVNDQKSTINLLGVSSIVSSGLSNFGSDTIVTSSVSTTSTTPVTVQSSCPITTSSVISSSILDSSDSECQEVESHNGPNEEMLKSLTVRMDRLENHNKQLQSQVSALMSIMVPGAFHNFPHQYPPAPNFATANETPDTQASFIYTPASKSQTPVSPAALNQQLVSSSPVPLPLPPLSITPPPLPPSIFNQGSQSTEPNITPKSLPKVNDLLDPDEVIEKYPKYRNISNVGRMAVRLASEAYFGKEVLQKSTVYGQQSNTPLPEDKVRALKKKILSLHPNYVDTPVEFEPIWTKCVNAINHHASGLRKKGTVVINLTE